uniref:Uncharacterized protein n=1 Tax=Gouania willdenowi TaxID=441366 RepID=A0A8C5HG97_GOUWI
GAFLLFFPFSISTATNKITILYITCFFFFIGLFCINPLILGFAAFATSQNSMKSTDGFLSASHDRTHSHVLGPTPGVR